MTLPDGGNIPWPPTRFKRYFDDLEHYDSWLAGDVDKLTSSYRNGPITRPSQYNGGVLGAASRAWYGKPPVQGERRARLHVPLAQDIATLSADYLFSEAPRAVLPGQRAEGGKSERDRMQERIEKVINTPRFHSTLLEAGEISSGLGGTFMRLTWDQNTLDSVRAEAVHADAGVPTFRFGDLASVIFWSQWTDEADDALVWRHLEEHRPGEIEHGLYLGTKEILGQRVDVARRPETAWLAEPGSLNTESTILTDVDGLTATYVPNMRPNTAYRKDPHLSMLGRSDFAQITQLFDAVDEVWSSWMRDIRVAKARIIVAQQYLESGGFGQGATFDYDREVYEGINTLTGPNGQPFGFHAEQFAIRVQEHADTVQALRDQAMRSAGWTPASAGGQGEGVRTATEINADERLSARTRDKKSNYWRGITPWLLTWAQLDARLYGFPAPEDEPEFRFPAEAQVDIEKMARVNQALYSAQAASIETRVRLTRPDWDGDTVNDEVDRIKAEFGVGTAADPTTVTGLTEPSPEDVARMRERMEREAADAAPDDE